MGDKNKILKIFAAGIGGTLMDISRTEYWEGLAKQHNLKSGVTISHWKGGKLL